MLGQPIEWHVNAAHAGVFAHITRDIGQLHRYAKITGTRQGIRITHAHQHAHHGADSTGNAGRIITDTAERVVAVFGCIPGKTFQKGLGQCARHLEIVNDRGKGAVFGGVFWLARIGGIQTFLQAKHRTGLIIAFVHFIIGQAAKRIEGQRRVTDLGRQQLAGGMERQRPVADRLAAMLKVVGADHSAATFNSGITGASGTILASTSALEITPGTPAPGCVPAPTR